MCSLACAQDEGCPRSQGGADCRDARLFNAFAMVQISVWSRSYIQLRKPTLGHWSVADEHTVDLLHPSF